MSRRLFGTDGVRGVAGELLTPELAVALGRAAVEQAGARRVLLVRDPRESGPMLEAALAAGAAAAGADVLLGGVLPTPAASAASSISPDSRVSRMTSTRGRSPGWVGPHSVAAARPRARASSAVSSSPATPRTPSVPKSLRAKRSVAR